MAREAKKYPDIPEGLIVLKPRQVRASIPKESEHEAIVEYLKVHDERLLHCWQLMAVLGARINDVLAFRTDDVREILETEELSVFEFFEQKTSRLAKTTREFTPTARRVPLTNTVRSVLFEAMDYADTLRSEWIIPSLTSGGRARKTKLCQQSCSRRFRQCFDGIRKIDRKKVRLSIKAHSARKLFCQRVLEQSGGDWREVKRAIGHRTVKATRAYLIDHERELANA